jgi:hypothetical protein
VVAEAAGASRAELLDLNPHILRGVTPPGAAYWVRVPAGRGDAAGTRLDALDDDRRAFRRVVTKKRESLEALAERAGVSAGLLRTYNPGLETVERGQYRGRLVGNQAVRVPTAEVLAYARSTPAYGAASGLPSLPAPPPEPAPAPKPTRAAARASARETARERESTDVARGARGAAPAKADKAKPAKADKAEPAKRLAAKGASAKAAPAKAASAKAAPARAAAEKAAPAKGAPAKTGTRAGDGKSTRAGDGKPAAGEGTKATVPAKPTAKQAAKKKDRTS